MCIVKKFYTFLPKNAVIWNINGFTNVHFFEDWNLKQGIQSASHLVGNVLQEAMPVSETFGCQTHPFASGCALQAHHIILKEKEQITHQPFIDFKSSFLYAKFKSKTIFLEIVSKEINSKSKESILIFYLF